MIVDLHNHCLPPTYLEAIRKGPSPYRLTEDIRGLELGAADEAKVLGGNARRPLGL